MKFKVLGRVIEKSPTLGVEKWVRYFDSSEEAMEYMLSKSLMRRPEEIRQYINGYEGEFVLDDLVKVRYKFEPRVNGKETFYRLLHEKYYRSLRNGFKVLWELEVRAYGKYDVFTVEMEWLDDSNKLDRDIWFMFRLKNKAQNNGSDEGQP